MFYVLCCRYKESTGEITVLADSDLNPANHLDISASLKCFMRLHGISVPGRKILVTGVLNENATSPTSIQTNPKQAVVLYLKNSSENKSPNLANKITFSNLTHDPFTFFVVVGTTDVTLFESYLTADLICDPVKMAAILQRKGLASTIFSSVSSISFEADFATHVCWVYENIYCIPYKNCRSKQEKVRLLHGVEHTTRVALYIPAWARLYAEHFPGTGADKLTPGDIKLMQITALFHDAGREAEDEDLWDIDSATLLYFYFTSVLGLTHEKTTLFAEAIANKDMELDQPLKGYHAITLEDGKIIWKIEHTPRTKNIYQLLLQNADCLDIQRMFDCKFDQERLNFFAIADEDKNEKALKAMGKLLEESKKLINVQGDRINSTYWNGRMKTFLESGKAGKIMLGLLTPQAYPMLFVANYPAGRETLWPQNTANVIRATIKRHSIITTEIGLKDHFTETNTLTLETVNSVSSPPPSIKANWIDSSTMIQKKYTPNNVDDQPIFYYNQQGEFGQFDPNTFVGAILLARCSFQHNPASEISSQTKNGKEIITERTSIITIFVVFGGVPFEQFKAPNIKDELALIDVISSSTDGSNETAETSKNLKSTQQTESEFITQIQIVGSAVLLVSLVLIIFLAPFTLLNILVGATCGAILLWNAGCMLVNWLHKDDDDLKVVSDGRPDEAVKQYLTTEKKTSKNQEPSIHPSPVGSSAPPSLEQSIPSNHPPSPKKN